MFRFFDGGVKESITMETREDQFLFFVAPSVGPQIFILNLFAISYLHSVQIFCAFSN